MSSCCSGVVKDVSEVEEGRLLATCCTCGERCSVVTEEDLDLSVDTVPMKDRLDAARNAVIYWRGAFKRKCDEAAKYRKCLEHVQSMRCLNDECADVTYREIQDIITRLTDLPVTGEIGVFPNVYR